MVELPVHFNLLVLKSEYSGRTNSILWLSMPWLFVSPGHQQKWCSHMQDKQVLNKVGFRVTWSSLCWKKNVNIFFRSQKWIQHDKDQFYHTILVWSADCPAYWGVNKMVAILQTIFSKAFCRREFIHMIHTYIESYLTDVCSQCSYWSQHSFQGAPSH